MLKKCTFKKCRNPANELKLHKFRNNRKNQKCNKNVFYLKCKRPADGMFTYSIPDLDIVITEQIQK